MPRIPQAELEKIKQEISLERLVESKGVKLKRHGQDLIGLCPFHNDKEPSLVVTPSKNLWHCLGACQAGGSVVDWVMKAEAVSFRHAVELLREDAPSLAAEQSSRPRGGRPARDGRTYVKQSSVRRLESPVVQRAEVLEQLRQVIDYYHQTLKQSPEALDYLQKRGLNSSEMIERFKIGFCNRTLGYRLPESNRKAGAEIRSRLEKIGLLRESGHEHFRGSLVVPVLGPCGEVLEVYGRKINDNLRSGTPKHLYLPGPHRGVWNIEALQASKEIILCESLLDALTFWCAGYRNVTSSYGIEGFTEEHLEALKHYGTERVLLAYDRDEAGDAAAESLGKELTEQGMQVFRVQFPRGMDANEYACQVKPATKSLGVVIRGATWMSHGKEPAQHPSATVEPSPASPAPQLELGPTSSPLPPTSLLAATAPEHRATDAAVDASTAPVPMTLTPEPKAPSCEVPAVVSDDEVVIRLGDRRWRVRGMSKNTSHESLRVNVLCSRGDAFFVDTFELYSARHRAGFLKTASDELEVKHDVLKRDLGKVLLKLEELHDAQLQATLAPKEETPVLSEQQRNKAMELLQDPKLLERILEDFSCCGVVGESVNKLVGYVATVSRKMQRPLAIIIQSSSAAGKSSLMEAILSLMPAEERVHYSAMTGQSLFYMGEMDLQHKILAIAEGEGAERAGYALKLLQSEGELTIASTGKDPTTGRLVTQDYRVKGPVMIMLTTTAIEIDEELLNRCVVLTVNEGRAQTQAIHQRQRQARSRQSLIGKHKRSQILELHHNAQRLLRPIPVVNPYAEHLTFLDDRTRTRRDHEKYLTLIDSIALLHQYQRPIQTIEAVTENANPEGAGPEVVEYIEATLDDIAVANRLAHDVLGRSLSELPPQTHRFLTLLDTMVTEICQQRTLERCDCLFSRREIRETTGWSYDQVRIHLQRLVDLEYVLVHRGGRGQSFVYELLYDGQGKDGRPFLPGLIDVEELRRQSGTGTTPSLGGCKESLGGSGSEFGGPFDPHLTPFGGPLGTMNSGATREDDKASGQSVKNPQDLTVRETKKGAHRSVGARRSSSSREAR